MNSLMDHLPLAVLVGHTSIFEATGVCSFRWNLAVFHRAGFHTSIVILWEKQSRRTRICTLTSKTSTPLIPFFWTSGDISPGMCSFCWNFDSFQVNSQKLGVQGCARFASYCANSCAPWLLFSWYYNGSVKTCSVKNSQISPKWAHPWCHRM